MKLGKEFDRLIPFKVLLEGDFGSIEISESCLLELQKIQLPRVETLSVTASILISDEGEPTSDPVENNQPVLYGLKRFDLAFAKEPVQIKILCGPSMNQPFFLTLRLYV